MFRKARLRVPRQPLTGEGLLVTTRARETILVYEPAADAPGGCAPAAARPATLNGKSVGLINNTKDLTDEIFDALGAGLQEQFPEVRILRYRKKSEIGRAHV